MTLQKETNKYKTAYTFKFISDAFFYPFFALYLSSTGKTEREIGFILMLLPLIAVIVNPVWNYLGKNTNYNRFFMAIFSIIEAVLIGTLIVFVNIYIVILVTILLSIVNQPVYSLLEGYTTVYTMQSKTSYSKIRLFGSIGYALGVLISGFLIVATDYSVVMIISSSFLILLSGMLFLIKPLKINEEDDTKGSFKELLKNKDFILFFFYYIIIMATLFGGESYWALYFDYRGIDAKTFGWIAFIAYALEIVFLLLLSKYGEKIKIKYLMIAVAIANTIRYFIFAGDGHLSLLILNSVIRAFIMGTLLYVIVRYLSLYVKSYNITLSMIVINSFKNIFQSAITLSGGFIIETYSYNMFFGSIGILSLISLLFIKYRTSPKYAIMSMETDEYENREN